MDSVFLNGRIVTLDAAGAVHDALGVCHGLIAGLGREREVRQMAGRHTQIVDLEGAALLPGLVDSHTHLMMYAYLIRGIDLSEPRIRRIKDILARVSEEAAAKPPGTWIQGYRFAEFRLAEKRYPTREELDSAAPSHPVILYHTSFHACVLNSQALKKIGIGRHTLAEPGGVIEKDPVSGEPTGALFEATMMRVFNQRLGEDLDKMSSAERVAMCARGTEAFARAGLVGTADAAVSPAALDAYQEAARADALKIRVYLMIDLMSSDALIQSGIRTGFGNDRLRIGPIKVFADGGMSSRTAAVSAAYLTPPHGRGLKLYPREELRAIVNRLHALGYQIAVHAQGDAALDDALEAFESVLGRVSSNPLRHRIEHAGCLYPALLKRAAALKIGVSSQPAFFTHLGDGFIEAFGEDKAQHLYPFKSMLRAGIPLGGSSDCPVIPHDPRVGLRDAVLRKTSSGAPIGLQESLTVTEALRMFTWGSAFLSFEEHVGGSLEIGKRADFTILAADPCRVEPELIPDIPVRMTVVGGQVVYDAQHERS